MADPNFTSSHPLPPTPNQQILPGPQTRIDAVRLQRHAAIHRAPRTAWGMFLRLTRTNAAIALAMPSLCGAILAWWQLGLFHSLAFIFHLGSILTMALGMNALNEHCDYRHAHKAISVGDMTAQSVPRSETMMSGYSLMMNGVVAPAVTLSIGYWMITASLLCSLWLTLLVGWPMLFFSGLSFILAYTYAHPPIQYGYRGWGLGELGIFIGYGLLPIVGSYYSQGQTLSWLTIWVSLPLGLLSTLLFFNYNLVHEYRDWLMHKRTLVVRIGTERALDVSAIVVLAVYIIILGIVSLSHLPLSALVTLAALPIALGAFSQVRRAQVTLEDRVLVYSTTVNAMIWTGLLFCFALLSDRYL
ncbi:MAG: prenyltransferase [Chloroflexi bacterium]|nr:prenyltransferase [Chloroflexota bacterium]